MCGITGFVDFNSTTGKEVLLKMTEALYHRGPDDSGNETFTIPSATLGFGFRRLSILDLSPAGHQPMTDQQTGNCIVFNGEIYNFKEIRSDLEKLGDVFQTQSDTEVILAAYRRWGTKCVDRFIGMFAIALIDANAQKLICFRDRAGVKPFFYYRKGSLFLFSSELKSFHQHPVFKPEIDPNAVGYYLQHGCITAPHTIFQYTFKLKPGHFLELNLKTNETTETCYWNVNTCYSDVQKSKLSFQEAADQAEELFKSAFNYRMIADVPVGLFLSGGYDSSCVAAILQSVNTSKIKTYTIGFTEAGYDEAPHAKKVAAHLGTDHHEHYCSSQEGMDLIPLLPDVYDEPFGDSSAIPTMLVSKAARQSVTVALSADGGDEIFAGYPRHRKSLNYIQKLKSLPFRKISGALVPSCSIDLRKTDRSGKLKAVLGAVETVNMFDIINQTFTLAEVRQLMSHDAIEISSPYNNYHTFSSGTTDLSRILALEYQSYLADDILQKVDRATMSVSLEGREPFLDHRIVEFAATLPDHFKMNENTQKVLLKKIVHKYIPEQIMNRPKMGFGVPVAIWLRTDLIDLFMSYMSDSALKNNPYLNAAEVKKLRDKKPLGGGLFDEKQLLENAFER